MHIDLISVDESRNRFRFYSMLVTRTLFEYEIEIQWGRIGSWRQMRVISASNLAEAADIFKLHLQRRFSLGYEVTSHALVDDLIDLSDIEIDLTWAA